MKVKMSVGWSMETNTIDAPPDLERVFRSVFTGYRGRKFRVNVTDHVSMTDTYWDGGSKSDYAVVDLASGRRRVIPDLISGGFLPTANAALEAFRNVTIPKGVVIVRHSIFCGKDTGLTLMVRADDLPPTLAEVCS